MTKKEHNQKNIQVNLRNKKINLFYKSTVKTLGKKIKKLINEYQTLPSENVKNQIQENYRLLTSKIDKAVKKRVLIKNTASRKKSVFSSLLKKNSISI